MLKFLCADVWLYFTKSARYSAVFLFKRVLMAETYTIVLNSCDSARVEEITVAMASAFPIRKEMALQLASSAPIAILNDLSEIEANASFNELATLSEAGAELTILKTDELGSAVSKVKWPEQPTINGNTVDQLAQEMAMEEAGGGAAGQAPVEKACPHCGNPISITMDGTGNVSVEAAGGKAVSVAGTDSAVMGAGVADSGGDDFILSNDDLIAEIEEPHIPKTEEITSVLDSLLPEDPGAGVQQAVGVSALEPVSAGPNTQQTIPQVPVQNTPPPPPPQAAPQRGETADDKKLYNVFLPKLSTDDKKEKAIPLMVELAGITNDEANKLANRIVIPLVKGVAKDRADEIKERFMAVGILPRIRQQV